MSGAPVTTRSTTLRWQPWRRALTLLVFATSVTACGNAIAGSTAAPSSAGGATQAPPVQATPDPTTASLPTPAASADASLSAAPRPTDVPARIAVPALGIDLAVVPGDLTAPGNPRDYPLCDVAQYLTTYRYPGRPGTTTWVYAHAREGMFLPLLTASEQNDGAALLGLEVVLDSTASRRYTYTITQVLRHAIDRSAAADVDPRGGRLIVQTSEGPSGTVPKLQVVAELVGAAGTPSGDPPSTAAPRVCAP